MRNVRLLSTYHSSYIVHTYNIVGVLCGLIIWDGMVPGIPGKLYEEVCLYYWHQWLCTNPSIKSLLPCSCLFVIIIAVLSSHYLLCIPSNLLFPKGPKFHQGSPAPLNVPLSSCPLSLPPSLPPSRNAATLHSTWLHRQVRLCRWSCSSSMEPTHACWTVLATPPRNVQGQQLHKP